MWGGWEDGSLHVSFDYFSNTEITDPSAGFVDDHALILYVYLSTDPEEVGSVLTVSLRLFYYFDMS